MNEIPQHVSDDRSRQGCAPVPGAPVSPLDARLSMPRPSDTPESPVVNAVRWLLAALGATFAVYATQLVSIAVGSFAVALVLLQLTATTDVAALAAQITIPVQIISELAVFAVVLPWWLRVRPVSFLQGRRRTPRSRALGVVAVVLLGVGLQMVISYALGLLLPLFPDVKTEYDTLTDNPVMNEFSVAAVLILAVGAPLTEELACRGVVFEFALRAMCPKQAGRWRDRAWRTARSQPCPPLGAVPPRAFWLANIVQAVLFGALHLNITQFAYATVMGLIAGWLVWQTGSLLPSMGLHLVINFCFYFVNEIATVLEAGGVVFAIVASAAMVGAGLWLFRRAVDRPTPLL